eukprot:maker-scaffold604_size126151-snap-gene-0.33 protein:Tk08220 transcript:maker-scaffold604_size126151-snap-gene-0.33-mRNA-1 annotation:"PREDICTED: uncharacterized protein LOC101737697"
MTEFFIKTIKVKTTGKKVLLGFLLFTSAVWTFEIEVSQDPVIESGEPVQINCSIKDSADIKDCKWFGPKTRAEYGSGTNERAIEVEVKPDLCTLVIRRTSKRDEGAWKCHITNEAGEEASTLAYLNVEQAPGKVEILLEAEKSLVSSHEGEKLEIICPFQARFADPRSVPTCNWIHPLGETFNLADRRGDVTQYEDQGISSAGDLDNGECGILIKKVSLDTYGHWTCEVLSTRSDGRPGTEIIRRDIILTKPEKEDFKDPKEEGFEEVESEKLLKGFRAGDRDVEIFMDINIPEDIEVKEVYWIVQRHFTIKEGQELCPEIDSRECYYSSERREVSDGKYEVKLTFDRLSQEDLQDPVVLIMAYKDKAGIGQLEVLTVPSLGSSQESDNLEDVTDQDEFEDGAHNHSAEEHLDHQCQESCFINKQKVLTGESTTLPNLCVKVTCDGNGAVTAVPLEGCEIKAEVNTNPFDRK